MTEQFNKALSNIYDSFRRGFIAANEGCNENDVERAFLRNVMKVNWWGDLASLFNQESKKATEDLIDSIR